MIVLDEHANLAIEKRLRDLATRFRAGLQAVPVNERYLTLHQFPSGSCGDASLLLADYLRDHGFTDIAYVLGFRGAGQDRHSHAWLVVDGFTVDITADQFEEMSEPIVVSRSSPFHDLFELEHGYTANYRDYNMIHNYPSLPSTYRAILQALGSA